MILIYSLVYTIARRGNDTFRHSEESLKEKPKDEKGKNTWL